MAYLHQNKIMEINKSDLLTVASEGLACDFMVWVKSEAPVIRFPWGDKGYSLESYVVSESEFKEQEQVMTDCSLDFQNMIYELKKLCIESNAELVFKF